MILYFVVIAMLEAGLGTPIIADRIRNGFTSTAFTLILAAGIAFATNLMLNAHHTSDLTLPHMLALVCITVFPWVFTVKGIAYGFVVKSRMSIIMTVLVNAGSIYGATIFAFDLIH